MTRLGVAAMQQIADWLKKLGMSEYAERFAKNDIEIDNLTELTITTWKARRLLLVQADAAPAKDD